MESGPDVHVILTLRRLSGHVSGDTHTPETAAAVPTAHFGARVLSFADSGQSARRKFS